MDGPRRMTAGRLLTAAYRCERAGAGTAGETRLDVSSRAETAARRAIGGRDRRPEPQLLRSDERRGRGACRSLAGAVLAALVVGACTMVNTSSGLETAPELPPPPEPMPLANIPDVTPRTEPPSASGNMLEYEQSGRWYRVLETSEGYQDTGLASWYGERFHGRRTSSGEPFDMYAVTAAHRTLPIPSYVAVTNLDNGRTIVVRVNDRGPFHEPDERIIDLSYAAAVKLGMAGSGTARVSVRAVEPWQRRVR